MHRRKYKDWALRLDLMGIPQLFLGVTDENHIFQRGEFLSVKKLTELGAWDLQKTYDFGFRALCMLRDHLQDATDTVEHGGKRWSKHLHNRVWLFRTRGKSAVQVREISREELCSLHGDNIPRTGIVPNDCLDRLNCESAWTPASQ